MILFLYCIKIKKQIFVNRVNSVQEEPLITLMNPLTIIKNPNPTIPTRNAISMIWKIGLGFLHLQRREILVTRFFSSAWTSQGSSESMGSFILELATTTPCCGPSSLFKVMMGVVWKEFLPVSSCNSISSFSTTLLLSETEEVREVGSSSETYISIWGFLFGK